MSNSPENKVINSLVFDDFSYLIKMAQKAFVDAGVSWAVIAQLEDFDEIIAKFSKKTLELENIDVVFVDGSLSGKRASGVEGFIIISHLSTLAPHVIKVGISDDPGKPYHSDLYFGKDDFNDREKVLKLDEDVRSILKKRASL